MADFGMQRLNMVESQVRPSDVTDRRLMRVLQSLPREQFVPAWGRAIAYADEDVPITHAVRGKDARFLLAPRTISRLVQAADISAGDSILDVGCGTGYSTAVLASLARQVIGIEEDAELVAVAVAALKAAGIEQATIQRAKLAQGWPAAAPYDVIMLNGSVPHIPAGLLAQLKDGGRLVAIVTTAVAARDPVAARGFGVAQVHVKRGAGFGVRQLFDAGAPPLPGFEKAATFAF